MPNKRHLLALAASLSLPILSLTALPAFAQTPAPMRIRATIEKIDGNTLTLKTRDGTDETVTLAPNVGVVGVSKSTIAEIKPDSFIGCAAIPQPNGTLKALEVTVFPPAMRGTGEGSYSWDLGPTSTMTNGTVSQLVGTQGRTMTVNYKGGGEKTIVVPDDVPIVSLQPADRSLLTVGAHVIAIATKAPDGSLTSARLNVGVNGLVPPM